MMKVNKILETCLYSQDLEASKKFYSEILGLILHSTAGNRHLFFRCGDAMFFIFNPEETSRPNQSVPSHGSQGAGHVAFSVPDKDITRWKEFLEQKGIAIEADIYWPAGGRSLYFRDPSNNSIELASPSTWGIVDGVSIT
jgi:catechol 2,3-dioxygenase-like lactoylglutathione lyase family enzyme